MKKFGALLMLLAAICLAGCNQSKPRASNEIRVGTIAGPETELMEVAKTVAAKNGIKIDIVQFTDYVLPNQALADGSIDANMFQHQPYLDETIAAKGYELTTIGKAFVYPMGVYSTKIKDFKNLPNKAVIAIPNDPSNEARALLLLSKANLIKLKPGSNIKAAPQDIIENPKQLKFKELDAAQLPRVLADVDLAVINTNYAMVAGIIPTRDALIMEDKDSPYANIIVVKTADKDDPKYAKLIEALHSPEVLQRAKELFQNQAIPAWTDKK